ncbi:MAG: hypothetical protein M3R36_00765 [Bacteroidota bacterium]|nr:hypothetical protein [Bacteroidota bacterium]
MKKYLAKFFLTLFLLVNILNLQCSKAQKNPNVLHSFSGSDGTTPKGTMTLSGNTLYGYTSHGGKNNKGVIFSMGNDGKGFKVLYEFTEGADDNLGNEPHHDAMLMYNNVLYGATVYGGNKDNGVIFKINTDGTGYSPIHIFKGGADDGAQPHSGVIALNNFLYGLTAEGGAEGKGVIYKMNSGGTDFSVLHLFVKATGHNPHGRLTLGSDGHTVFGITKSGGSNGEGVLFSYDLSDSGYSVIHNFQKGKIDGTTSEHGFLTRVDNKLYGMTHHGGEHDKGIIFSINEDSSGFQVIHSFNDKSKDGNSPFGSLQFSNGFLYGTTHVGGDNDKGTIFRINADGKKYETVFSYDTPTTGEFPIDNVVFNNDASELYCFGQQGGVNDETGKKKFGTIIKLKVSDSKK